ncbi:unnamed protein product [Sympodiomycopsis kandeliae]
MSSGSSSPANVNQNSAIRKQSQRSSDEDEELPLAKRSRPSTAPNGRNSVNGNISAVKPEPQSEDSDSDAPLTGTRKPQLPSSSSSSARASSSKTPATADSDGSDSDSDDDAPLGAAQQQRKPSSTKRGASSSASSAAPTPAKRSKVKAETPQEDNDDDEDDDDEEEGEGDDEDEDDEEGGSKKSNGVKHAGDGAQMWETLYHTGPRFPPPYERIPSDIKLKYNGKPVELSPQAEEAALFYAVKLETPYVKDPVFNSNFFKDFQTILKSHPPTDGTKITSFEKLDFVQMCEYQKGLKEAEKERKKKLAPSARKKETADKKAAEDEMKTCLVDGKKQRVGNVMVEPPALFMGRGQHPKRGQIKPRTKPEGITINHTLKDPDHPPPAAPDGHKWKAVVEMKDVTWLAHWIDFNGNYKYVYLDSTSSFKSNSDREKFEKARKLDKCVDKLRQRIEDMLVSKSRAERQLGTVVWLIDNYSLRAGNEKGEDEAATYGVCSLLVEHVKELVDEENKVQLEFLGKDSMLFKETLEVPERIFKNIKMFTRSTKDTKGKLVVKKPTDAIFERVDTSAVNRFLRDPSQGGMAGLSAKVFRTYNASTTFQGLLNRTAENLQERGMDPTPQSLKDEYMQANRLVAILCNHQKTINPQVAERQHQRAGEKMVALKYEIHKERQKILTLHKSVKDVKKEFPAKDYKEFNWSKLLEEDLHLSNEQIKEHEEKLITGKINRLEATFERQELEREYQEEQARLNGSGSGSVKKEETPKKGRGKKGVKKEESEDEDEKPKVGAAKMKTKEEVQAEKKRLEDLLKQYENERKTGKAEDADSIRVESCARKIKNKFETIRKFEADLDSKNKTSDVSLGTSKLNYIDPRITVSWLLHWDKILVDQESASSNGSPKKGSKGSAVKKEDKDEKKPNVKKSAAGATPNTGLDLDLQKLPIGQYFPKSMQSKFRWAQESVDAKWKFVPGAEDKVRDNFSSSKRKEVEDEINETRRDDNAKGGKKSAAAGKGSSGKKAATNGKAKKVEEVSSDSDSDAPLGGKK